jgi:hypothetical protein
MATQSNADGLIVVEDAAGRILAECLLCEEALSMLRTLPGAARAVRQSDGAILAWAPGRAAGRRRRTAA